MAVFEFVALTCIKTSELDGDEIYIEYNGVKVFPGADQKFRAFRSGSRIVNDQARIGRPAIAALLEGSHSVALSSIVGAEALRRAPIPDTGLLVRVMEYDSFSPDDLLGMVLVSDLSRNAMQEIRLDGDGGHYVLAYLVQPGER
jgi:hypothetical protein